MWRTDPFPLESVHHVAFGSLAELERLLSERGDRVAAVIGEPIQGNGGIVVPPDEFWPGVRRLTREHGALLVVDEIQTAFNRTGRWFACEHWGVVPDVVAISKAMGNGFPIAAFMTTDDVARSYTRPGASTYGGNPVCATAALATLEFHRRHRLGERAAQAGHRIGEILASLAHTRPCLRNPRGRGLMIGIDVVTDVEEPDAPQCDRILERLKDHGVLAGKTGPGRNTLTLLPPLIITDEQIGELHHALASSI
jgi:4-aminobutyrate aminotransferase-like enzyme